MAEQIENERRWRHRAEAERDALQLTQDAYAALEQVYGSIFDIVQRNRRLRESLEAVVNSSIQGESDECLICGAVCDNDHRHTEDCPVLAAERILELSGEVPDAE